LKFLVDECTGIYVSNRLRALNFDCTSVIECMRGADDEEIIKRAVIENRVIVTNDKGFGRLAEFYKPPGIILLRLKDESTENKVKVVSFVVTNHSKSILGNLLVVSEKRIRARPINK